MAIELNETRVKPLNKLKTAQDLKNHYESLKRGRQNLEAQWKLNIAFYKGKQYTYYDRATRRILRLPTEDGEKPRYVVRVVNNQIVTGAHALLAKFTKTKPVMNATPASGSEADCRAAQVADKLLRHWWHTFHLDDKLAEALLWSIVTGNGYWYIRWDPEAGDSVMRFLLDPQGNPITDTLLADLFRQELLKQGVIPQETVVMMGDIRVDVPAPFDVYLDDAARVFDDCRYVIIDHYLSPEEIKDKYGLEVKPDAHINEPETLFPFGGGATSEKNVKTVHCGIFKPQAALPNGRYVVWIDDKIVEDSPWPYPFEALPIVKFPGVRVPGSIYDISVVEQAIPIQKDLNKTLSQLIEYKNLTLKPRIWSPVGALQGIRLTSEPGAVYEYNPIGEHRPQVEELPSIPPYVFEHLERLRRDIREVFHIVDITEGVPPPNVEAGVAIDLLQEMATDRLAPTILLIERALERAGNIMLKYAQKYYQEPRLIKLIGSGGGYKIHRFTQADLQGGVNVTVEAGSALPRTRAGRQARILQYISVGLLSPEHAFKYLDIADLEGLGAAFKADEDQASREHDKILAGEPINVLAMQEAMRKVEAGEPIDDSGTVIRDQDEAQSYIFRESLRPLPYENLSAHLDVHALFMKSQEFEKLPPDLQQAFLMHFQLTQEEIDKLPKPMEFAPVRPTLQIKSTAGPTTTAKILQKAGVDTTPEDLMEPPLETWISDSLDKPDVEEAGNDPLSQLDLQMKQLDIESKLADARLRTKFSATDEVSKQIDLVTKAELAKAQVRKAHAEADIAQAKAKEFKK